MDRPQHLRVKYRRLKPRIFSAIGRDNLLQDYFDSESLARASDIHLETRRGYFCCLTEHGINNPAAHQFRDWGCLPVKA